jgi:ribosomal-protein-alanine N-acetyltransferase
MIIFETERLIVRHFTAEDKDNFFSLNGDEELMRYIRKPKTKEECDRFLEETIAGYKDNPATGRWAVDDKLTGAFIGSFALLPVPGSDEWQLGYALLKNYWGKGLATELMRKGTQYVFEKMGWKEVYGLTEAAHVRSQNVLRKSGFRLYKTYLEGEKEIYCFRLRREAD